MQGGLSTLRSRGLGAALTAALTVAGCGGGDATSSADAADGGVAQLQPATAATLLGPWRPSPLVLDPVLIASIDRTCRADMPIPPQAPLVVVDARGGAMLQPFYAGPDGSIGSCVNIIVRPDGTLRGSGGGSTGTGERPRVLKPFEIRLESMAGEGGGQAGQVISTQVSGRVGAGIAYVVIRMPGQEPVLASLTNGWYAAWWPGPVPPGSKVVGYDRDRQQVATDDL